MYQFTDDCLTGINEIDEEHKRLFQLINETMDMLKTGDSQNIVLNLLMELKVYAENHFAHEEAYMEKIGDKELPRQRVEHAQFKEKISGYAVTTMTEETSSQIAQELLSYMAKWLYRHILGSDIMIGKFMDTPKKEDVFTFTSKYKTGIAFVDGQHRKLFEIIKETHEVIEAEFIPDKYDQIVHILNELRDYTVMHFRDEEEYMESINYEGIYVQRMAHNAFVDRLNEINLEDVDDNQKEYLDELINFLIEWLIGHILKLDKKIPVK